MSKGIILSGMRPTGKLHIGHMSVLENWVKMQQEYVCYFMVADLHSLTTKFDDTENLHHDIREMVLDWLAVGIDPVQSAVFVQSSVKEHSELHLYLSMNVPVSWLERCPTYKDQIVQFGQQGKDITTYGFLGYPVLMASDILLYLSDTVPVGEDQLSHLEISREIARRFNYLYKTDLFPEPKAKLGKYALVPGTDGRKMSKSYGNVIGISATSDEIKKQVNSMVTDPGRVRREDKGNPDVCIVHKYHEIYNNSNIEPIRESCRNASRGCVDCKKELFQVIDDFLTPVRERRSQYENSTYEDLREYLQKLRAGLSEASETSKTDEAPVREILDIFWKKWGRKDKELIKKMGGQLIEDYLSGALSLSDVKSLLEAKFDYANLVLVKGKDRAQEKASKTIEQVRTVMNLRY